MPHDESTVSRQTSGWKEGQFDINYGQITVIIVFFAGATQAGMTGFGAFRNTTVAFLQAQASVSNKYTVPEVCCQLYGEIKWF